MTTPIRMYTNKDAQHLAEMGKEMIERGFDALERKDSASARAYFQRADIMYAFAEFFQTRPKEYDHATSP